MKMANNNQDADSIGEKNKRIFLFTQRCAARLFIRIQPVSMEQCEIIYYALLIIIVFVIYCGGVHRALIAAHSLPHYFRGLLISRSAHSLRRLEERDDHREKVYNVFGASRNLHRV